MRLVVCAFCALAGQSYAQEGRSFELGPARFVDEVQIAESQIEWELSHGYVFALQTDAGGSAGFAFVGDGAAAVAFSKPWEARALAGTLLLQGDDGADALALVASAEQPWVRAFDVALFLTGDPAIDEVVDGLPLVDTRDDAVGYVDDSGMWNVVVTSLRGPAAARRLANRVLSERIEALDRLDLHPADALQMDALDGAADARWVVEARTAAGLGALLSRSDRGTKWLSYVRDPSGTFSVDNRAAVFVHSDGVERVVTAEPFGPVPARRAQVERGLANVVVKEEDGGSMARVDTTAHLVLTGGAHPVRTVPIALPHEVQRDWYGQSPQADGFDITGAELADGTRIEVRDCAFGAAAPPGTDGGAWESRVLVLPEALEPGERVAVRVHWTDHWQLRHTFEYELAGETQYRSMGTVIAPKRALPIVLGQPSVFDVDVRVGTTMDERHSVIVNGAPQRAWRDGDARWTWNRVSNTDARVALGKWRTHAFSAPSFPDVNVWTHSFLREGADEVPMLVRAVLHYYRDALPPYPYERVDVLEAPSEYAPAASLFAEPGQIVMRSAVAFDHSKEELWARNRLPHLEARGVVFAMAHHWWDEPRYAAPDRWIPGTMARIYTDLFYEAAWGDRDAQRWTEMHDRILAGDVQRNTLSFVAGHNHAEPGLMETVASRVLGGALRAYIGDQAFLAGLDAFLRGAREGRSTTEDLRASWEDAIGVVSLADFFDVWVYTGARPEVELTWRVDGDWLYGELTTDLALGRLDVPVRVEDRRGARLLWVPVIDGVGTVEYPVWGAPEVEVDPHEWFPWRSVDVKRPRLQPQADSPRPKRRGTPHELTKWQVAQR